MPSFIIGAEIMDDPAATPEMVDHWFKILADYQMPLARVFIPTKEDALRRMDGFFAAAVGLRKKPENGSVPSWSATRTILP